MPNTNFPTSIDAPTDPTSSNTLNSPSHSAQHSFENDAIVALEAKVGVNGSAVNTTLDYKLSGVVTGDKAASLTGTEALTNKSLGAGTVLNLGSDATGDIYYRNGSGQLARLPIGSTGQILDVSVAGLPEWIANPSAANASTTVKGVAQIAATADITAGTSTGSTGATLVVPASAVGAAGANKLVQYDSSGKLPAVDGSQLTNIAAYKIIRVAGAGTNLGPTAETTIFTTTINGNSISANGMIRVRIPLRATITTTAGTWTVRLKYGGSTVASSTLVFAAQGGGTAGSIQGFIDGWIINNGATNSQNVGTYLTLGLGSFTGTGTNVWPAATNGGDATSAIDTTVSQTLAVTVQSDTTGAGSVIFYQGIAETIKN